MRLFTVFFLATLISNISVISVAAENELTKEQIRDGWILLFDGETLFGWQPTSEANWQVVDGAIRASEGTAGFLVTTTRFADYQLHVDFLAEPKTNSGLFLHTQPVPSNPATDCCELNIAPPENAFPTGSVVKRQKAELRDVWDGHWHTYDVTLVGGKLAIQFDGKPLLEYVDPQPLAHGHIGLQFREGPIAFRNLRIKPLGTKPIFSGRDLTGWNTDRAEKSRFEVTPAGELRVLDGRGQLESDGQYGDFVLQLECLVDGEGLNSGIFFRCIPGDFMMGYECQIHNGMQDDDPAKPSDCGTGGIFRRQNARRIVARDRQWFALTLAADGPHMAAWVDGYQVSDWTDTRRPHENPRKGLRLAPGTLAIQGHDPTTDLRFRKLRIEELPGE